jgi:AhpD family alkylhydroperoxidase
MTVLSNKTEALLALGIAATVGCDSCIEHHVQDALDTGATEEEVQHTIALARRIGGKPSMTCCDEAMETLSHGEGAVS